MNELNDYLTKTTIYTSSPAEKDARVLRFLKKIHDDGMTATAVAKSENISRARLYQLIKAATKRQQN